MPVPGFTLLAQTCFCKQCSRSARGAVPRPGRVTGHFSWFRPWGARLPQPVWRCVYCGFRVVRHTPLALAWVQSVRDWLGWVAWEVKVGRMLRRPLKG